MIGSIVKALAGAVLGVVVLLHSPPAKADLFTWSYTGLHGYSVTAGGTFTATDDGCCGLFTVTSITGTWNGSPITLLPPNSYGFNDNKIRPLGAPDQLTFNGFAFSVAGEMDVFNVFYNYDTVMSGAVALSATASYMAPTVLVPKVIRRTRLPSKSRRFPAPSLALAFLG